MILTWLSFRVIHNETWTEVAVAKFHETRCLPTCATISYVLTATVLSSRIYSLCAKIFFTFSTHSDSVVFVLDFPPSLSSTKEMLYGVSVAIDLAIGVAVGLDACFRKGVGGGREEAANRCFGSNMAAYALLSFSPCIKGWLLATLKADFVSPDLPSQTTI